MPSNSWLASPAATRHALERHGLWAKHRLGQNFLVSDEVVGRIVALADLSGEECVLEVGPGLGTLTVALLEHAARVVAVEADAALLEALREDVGAAAGRLEVVVGDALRVVPDGVPGDPTALVSNLPYQVAATLVLEVFQTMPHVGRAVVMVQREVADRICAAPATKAYGAYTAKLALLARPAGRFEVGRSCFWPAPHVDSAVVRLDRAPLAGVPAATPAVIDAAFSQRRKTIRNAMSGAGYDKGALDAAFARAGVDPACRAETLAPADFVRLAAALGEGDGDGCPA